jgi:hypothetical protein
MRIAKRYPPSVPVHRTSETETAVWIMIVALLGSISFAIACLLHKVGG